jgi:hypothetical protein
VFTTGPNRFIWGLGQPNFRQLDNACPRHAKANARTGRKIISDTRPIL